MIENVSAELKKYFENKSIFSPLLGLDMIIFYAAAGLAFLSSIVFLGGFISAILTYAFFIGLLLCLANNKFQELMIGLGVMALGSLISLFRGFFGYYFVFSWSSFFALGVYGFLAYLAYKKTLQKA